MLPQTWPLRHIYFSIDFYTWRAGRRRRFLDVFDRGVLIVREQPQSICAAQRRQLIGNLLGGGRKHWASHATS